MTQLIKFEFTGSFQSDWIASVPTRIQLEIESKLPKIRTATKRKVQSQLFHKHGVDKGIYRRSFKINNFADSKWKIGFQVFARKPHHRLTHLLEGRDEWNGGHKIVVFTRGRGEKTAKGNIGMSWVKTRNHPNGYTNRVIHIETGQRYAEDEVIDLYENAPAKILGERLKRK